MNTLEARASAAAEWVVLEKSVPEFLRCETKATGVVVYAMAVYVRSVAWDTNLLPHCFGAVDCAVVMVSVEAKMKGKERTQCLRRFSKP